MVTVRRTALTNALRRGSRRAAVASGCALALAGSALVATPTRADDRQITAADQAYFSYYHLDAARAKGYTGKGVTIAIIDGKVDTSVPELAGANVVDKSPCAINGSNESASHGTGVASLLVSQDYGIVPDATLLAYQSIDSTSYAGKDCPMKAGALPTDLSSLVNQAINDGASIVNFSASSSMRRADLKWAIARAMSQGVIITASVGNGGADENENHLSRWSGVVGVSAIDTDGKFASYSSWGQGVTTTAVGGPFTERNISDGKSAVPRAPLIPPPSLLELSLRHAHSGPTPPQTSSYSCSLTQLLVTKTVGISTADTEQQTSVECSTPTRASTPTKIRWPTRAAVPAPPLRRSSSTPTALSILLRLPTTIPTPTAASTKHR